MWIVGLPVVMERVEISVCPKMLECWNVGMMVDGEDGVGSCLAKCVEWGLWGVGCSGMGSVGS